MKRSSSSEQSVSLCSWLMRFGTLTENEKSGGVEAAHRS
jgi:hypothetical protein